jgi:NADH-quinone oxidoreductase subunit H
MSPVLALLQQLPYQHETSTSVWEALRIWLATEPFPGWRLTAGSANVVMLISALLFVFLLELLLTIGIQVWERRVLGRMQSRWGPQIHGGITPKSFKAVLIPIVVLLVLPTIFYALEYWSGRSYWIGLPALSASQALLAVAGIGVLVTLISLFRSNRRMLAITSGLSVGCLVGTLLTKLLTPEETQKLHLWPELAIDFAIPHVSFGSLVPWLTLACTVLAFLIYLVYTFVYAWRQGFFDAIKIFFKEDVVPQSADKFLFLFAPVMVYLPALLSWIVIPFGVMVINGQYVYLIVKDLNVGLLLIIADFAMFLVAIIMSGYGSNNKYALIGAMREAAMLLTYEIPMLMSLLCVALFAGSLNLTAIVQAQSTTWAILPLFPAFVIYLICGLAETNRPPFDLAEASNELLGGYLVEYSGIRFALFYIAEYANIFVASALTTACFLGGWHGPMFLGYDGLWLTSLFWFLLKTYAVVFCFIWARATMPRIRVDQIMFFSWKFLLPASVVMLALTAMGVAYKHPWFLANRMPSLIAGPQGTQMTVYTTMTTLDAVATMNPYEKAFFWLYNAALAAIALFLAWLAWKVLAAKRQFPTPRREITWS